MGKAPLFPFFTNTTIPPDRKKSSTAQGRRRLLSIFESLPDARNYNHGLRGQYGLVASYTGESPGFGRIFNRKVKEVVYDKSQALFFKTV
jgi:hypothetical protein